MQHINNLITAPTQSTTASGIPTSEVQQKRREYFFSRIATIYGETKFNRTWPTKESQEVALVEWGIKIDKLSKDQQDAMFERLKAAMIDDSWPSIPYILSFSKTDPIHKPYEKLALPKPPCKKDVALNHLKGIKAMVGVRESKSVDRIIDTYHPHNDPDKLIRNYQIADESNGLNQEQ